MADSFSSSTHFEMNNDGKKITFSISKVKKNALVNKVNLEPKEKIEYVDCFDGAKGKFSYKGNIRNDDSEKPELVIPMPVSKTSAEIIRSRIEEKLNQEKVKKLDSVENNVGEEKKPSEDGVNSQPQSQSLEELAIVEILNEVKNGDVENKSTNDLVIKAKVVPQEPSEADIDYNNIPVTDFGLAMLRGMGWKPGLGIGKDPRLVEAASPKLRPKGLGLGAEPKNESNNEKKDEEKSSKTSSSKKKSGKT